MERSSHSQVRLLQSHPERMGLALLSLTAGESYSRIEIPHYLERIVALAEDIACQLPQVPATGDILYAMNTRLFDDLGLHANVSSGDALPLLHLLLDERHGRPVTLVILYLTIGRLLNLPLECVSLGGHLLVRVTDDGVVIDPVAGGVVLSDSELQQLLASKLGSFAGPAPRYQPFLQRLDDRAVMVRMLRHHKRFYVARQDLQAALRMVEMILDLIPDSATELLARARLLEQLQQHEAAAADYLRYLESNSDSDSRCEEELYQRMQLLLATPTVAH